MKRFERSNGLDTALYKNYLYLFFYMTILLRRSSWEEFEEGLNNVMAILVEYLQNIRILQTNLVCAGTES